MERTAVLILNPLAGGGARTAEVRELLAARPWCRMRETRAPEDMARLAREAVESGADVVIAAGGDGAVGQVLEGISVDFSAVQLGILPAGTGNDFARTIGIPTDPAAALAVIEAGEERRIDVVRIRDRTSRIRHMINAATGGFSSLLDQVLDPDMKSRWGRFAYLIAAVRNLQEIPLYDLRISFDDEVPIELRSCAVVLANGRYAGGIQVAPTADERDRQLDVTVVTAETLRERAALTAHFAAGVLHEAEGVVLRRARRALLEAVPPMPFHADGEDIGTTPLEFELLPEAVRLIVP